MTNQPVKLKGITLKGRNRVAEHGDYWTKANIDVSIQALRPTQSLYVAVKDGYMKWGLAPDFEEVRE